MVKIKNRVKSAVVQARENTAAYYAKNAGKSTAWDKVKDYVNTGRQYQAQAIEDRAQYYKENIGYSNDGTDKWLKAGAFEDGWQLGDGAKSYIASLADGWRQTKAGVYGLGEKAADTVLMVSPLLYGGLEPAEERSIYPVYSFDPEKREREKQLYGEWVAEDLYDEEAMAENIYTARIMEKLGIDVERDSLLGEKAKDFSYRAGQEAAIYALKEAKIPQWFTRGIVTFAEEAENALRSGADYDEALKSALIHAGAEAAATALSTSWKRLKNIKINDKTIEKYFDAFIDEKRFKNVSEDMSRYSLRAMIKSGFDIMTEGIETLFVWGTGKYAESITYQSDKTFRQLIESEEAKTKLWEAFWQGYIFGYLETSEDD